MVRVRADPARKLRLFSYQSLQIAESIYQETAYVDEPAKSLVHYKRRFYFEFFGDPTFTRAVCGEHSLKGLRGTYVDAEDGLLEGRAIAHGAADSALQWDVDAVPDRDQVVSLFVAIGTSTADVHTLREYVRAGHVGRFEEEARAFWRAWVRRRMPEFPTELSPEAASVYQTSVVMMRHAAGSNGSIIASPDTTALAVGGDTYNYCWWRDGGYVSKAMDEAGLYEYAQRFLEFAALSQSPDGSFLHRHFPDGAVGSTWHPPPFLQVDQTATVVAAVWHHFKRGADSDALLNFWPLVKGAATFLAAFRDPDTGLPAASYDLWEERKGIHTYSTATVIHALERAARIARELGKDATDWRAAADEMRAAARQHLWDAHEGRFVRSLAPRDAKIDSSVLLALKLGLVPWDDPVAPDHRRHDRAAAVEPRGRRARPVRGRRVLRPREPVADLHALARRGPAPARPPGAVPGAHRMGGGPRDPDAAPPRADRRADRGTPERRAPHLVPLDVRRRRPQVSPRPGRHRCERGVRRRPEGRANLR